MIKNKTLTLFDQFEKIVKDYLPDWKSSIIQLYVLYKDQFKTKGVKALLGFVQWSEKKNMRKDWIGGCLIHDLNGIGDPYLSPRSSGYYKYYKSPAI
jgi:hypothetical protein